MNDYMIMCARCGTMVEWPKKCAKCAGQSEGASPESTGPAKVVAAGPTGWGAHVERLQIGEMRDVGDWWQDQFGELHRVNDREKITTLHCPHYRITGLKRPNTEVSEGGTRDSRIETAAQSRPSLH
jgi:hypothetical protein